MFPFRWFLFLGLTCLLAIASPALAQRAPRIGYVYPAGGQQGQSFEVTLGGQFLDGASDVVVSGNGVRAKVVEHKKPMSPKKANKLRQQLRQLQTRIKKLRDQKKNPNDAAIVKMAQGIGIKVDSLAEIMELRRMILMPKNLLSPQLAEQVRLRVTLSENVEPGEREIRLMTTGGLTNPLSFHVGRLPEVCEVEPNNAAPHAEVAGSIPLVLNGQIMPGDVDRFAFEARKGTRLVIAASARELIPYLADAVPGWFQATLALYDAEGKELAYADDFRFQPDPVFYYEIPEDGRYVIEIKDALYRGREDFVYRIRLGELPFVTSIFPLGGQGGEPAEIELAGWNLPTEKLSIDAAPKTPGVQAVPVADPGRAGNRVRFAVDTLPECLEAEPNNEPAKAQQVDLPTIVNGRTDPAGDWDVFCFDGRAGDEIVAEVMARRLNSPLDSLLELIDPTGKQLAVNDDFEDRGSGLTTHHADSQVSATLPADGSYCLRLGDTQGKGGGAFAYRLRISPRRPDFELRVVPSTINAQVGATVPLTVYALRRDGFSDDITLELKDAPEGFRLGGGWVPAGQDSVQMTLSFPPTPLEEPVSLRLVGLATIDDQEVRRPAIPAEDMMQAFIYRHLVEAQDLMVTSAGQWKAKTTMTLDHEGPIKLPAGETADVQFAVTDIASIQGIDFTLQNAPDGIAIKKTSRQPSGVTLVIQADAGKIEPGLKGNLIVDAFIVQSSQRAAKRSKAPKRRVPLGVLPAIPFEVVAP